MSRMMAETAQRLFNAHANKCLAAMPQSAEAGATPWQSDLWEAIEAAGFPLVLLPVDRGGFGLTPAEALSLVEIAARFAAPVPLAETMAANWLLAQAGFDPAEGPAVDFLPFSFSTCTVVSSPWMTVWDRSCFSAS